MIILMILIKILDSPEVYVTNGVLSMADEEVDIYLRQLSNKKKLFSYNKN